MFIVRSLHDVVRGINLSDLEQCDFWFGTRRTRYRGAVPPRSDNFSRQANDFHELAIAQLAGDRSEDARAPRVLFVIDQHDGVPVKLDVRAVGAAGLVSRPYYDATNHVTGLDVAA
jgi:hypothetical protein